MLRFLTYVCMFCNGNYILIIEIIISMLKRHGQVPNHSRGPGQKQITEPKQSETILINFLK